MEKIMSNGDLDKRLKEGEKAINEAQMKTNLALLKMERFRLGLNLKTSDYETLKSLEAQIKELEEKDETL